PPRDTRREVATAAGRAADRAGSSPNSSVESGPEERRAAPTLGAMPSPALTIVGLDAATLDVVDPLIERGDLPHLAGLRGEGRHGVLHSTVHPLTTQAWSTMVTGVNAGRHGMWDFTERDATGYRLRLVNGSFRRAPAVWDLLSAAGRPSGVVNVPFTWPAQPIDGFMLAGLDAAAREAGMSHPPELVRELRERFGRLELDHSVPLDRSGHVDMAQVWRAARQKADAVAWLCERFHPD